MCGRYVITSPIEALRALFRFGGARLNLPARYNVAPTQVAPVVRRAEAELELAMMRWGLVPSWSKEIGTRPLFNARGETVAEKPSFRRAFATRRCLVPANGFYEWPEQGPLASQPVFFHRRREAADEEPLPLFAFAGIWERWTRPERGEALDSYAIISTEANGFMREYHHRIPVILAEADHATWLDGEPEAAKALLRSAPEDWLAAYPVSPRVNSARVDEPGLIEPLATVAAPAPPRAEPKAERRRAKKDDRQADLF